MAFATTDDIAARLGRDSLTAAELSQATSLIEGATAVIAEAVDKDDAWVAALDPVPNVLRVVTVEAVVRAMANPSGLRSESEQLGSYQHSQSFRDDGGGFWLTTTERMLVRRAVWGALSGSSRPTGVVEQVYDVRYDPAAWIPEGQ